MTWNFPLFTSIFVLNVVLSLWLAFTVWHYGKVPGVRVFAVMLLASAFWSFGHMLEIGVEQAWAKILWSKTQYLGAVIIGPAWFIFTLHYRGKIKQVRFRYVALMSVIPIITVGLVWTNELHNLIWSSITPSPNNPSILNYQHGVWFWVAIAYNHTLVLSGTWNIFQVLRAAPLEKRSQSKALLIGAVIPTMGNIFYVFGISPVQGADITPFLLTITGIIYLVTVLRFRLFDIRRVARREIIDKMRDGMLVVDEKYQLVDVNPSALHLLGVSKALVGKNVELSLAPYPAILDLIRCPQPKHVTLALGGQPPRHLEVQVSEFQDVKGEFAGKLVVLRDVTERVEAEKIAFETAIEQHRMHLLTQFIRDTSHEFRTPLSIINTSLYLMEKSNDSLYQKTRRETIQLQAKRLDLLISEMLISTQLDENLKLERARLGVNALLKTVTHEQAALFTDKRQQLIVSGAQDDLFVSGDAFMLGKALANILQNASRYTPEGGTITVKGAAHDQQVSIEISDNGIGMSAETQARIFERFFRADDSHSTPGFGLGLSIAQAIIAKHGGEIGVESLAGSGATFTIRLPQVVSESLTLPELAFATN